MICGFCSSNVFAKAGAETAFECLLIEYLELLGGKALAAFVSIRGMMIDFLLVGLTFEDAFDCVRRRGGTGCDRRGTGPYFPMGFLGGEGGMVIPGRTETRCLRSLIASIVRVARGGVGVLFSRDLRNCCIQVKLELGVRVWRHSQVPCRVV